MPQIYDKEIVASGLTEAIEAIASYRRKKVADVEEDIAFELKGEELTGRTIKSWKNRNSIPSAIEDGCFFGLIYLSLRTERIDLGWLTQLLKGTSTPFYHPVSPSLLRAYLSQARFQDVPVSEQQIEEVIEIFFFDRRTEAAGLTHLYKTGQIVNPLQKLIPLEPITSEYIRQSKETRVLGISLFRYLEAFFHDFVYALKNGAEVKVILVDPYSSAMEMVALRSTSQTSIEDQRQRILATIRTLERMKKLANTDLLQLKLINYTPAFGLTIYSNQADKSKSVCQTRLYTFRTPSSEAPVILFTPHSNSAWFDLCSYQFELMWNTVVNI